MDTYGYKSMADSLGAVRMSERQRAQALAHARLCSDMLTLFRRLASSLRLSQRGA